MVICRRLKRVTGQNVSGQNGTNKMERLRVYGQIGIGQFGMDKMARTTWYGNNGRPTDKLLRIKSSINPAPIDNIIFSSIPLSL